MMEWNNDEISKLIDFIEKRSFMYDPSDVSMCRLGDLLCLFCVYPFVSLLLFVLMCI